MADLEKRLGVRLLQRSTRVVTLTEAGQRFYEHCIAALESAEAAYESIAELKKEAAGMVRVSCPVVLAQTYLAPILPDYMARHPKVTVLLEATDRPIHLIEERFDIAIRARLQIEDTAGLVAKRLGHAKRVMVASPVFLNQHGRPSTLKELSGLDCVSGIADLHDGDTRWELVYSTAESQLVYLKPRIISSDLRVQFESAAHDIGVALLPEQFVSSALRTGHLEQVLPDWSAHEHIVHLVYPTPRGMLPSVRSLIDYMLVHIPASILARSA